MLLTVFQQYCGGVLQKRARGGGGIPHTVPIAENIFSTHLLYMYIGVGRVSKFIGPRGHIFKFAELRFDVVSE